MGKGIRQMSRLSIVALIIAYGLACGLAALIAIA